MHAWHAQQRLRTSCHACPLQNGPWCIWLWLRNYIKIFSDLHKLNLSNIIKNLYFSILTVTKLWPNNYINLSELLGANALCPVTNYYWAHQIYIILSILGPPSPPCSALIVLTAVQVYICRHQMAVNETAQHRTKTVTLMLYTWPAVYIIIIIIISRRPAVHTATWQLIKNTFNSPLLSPINPNTNPYPNPNPAHRPAVCIVTLKRICTCYIEHVRNFLIGSLWDDCRLLAGNSEIGRSSPPSLF